MWEITEDKNLSWIINSLYLSYRAEFEELVKKKIYSSNLKILLVKIYVQVEDSPFSRETNGMDQNFIYQVFNISEWNWVCPYARKFLQHDISRKVWATDLICRWAVGRNSFCVDLSNRMSVREFINQSAQWLLLSQYWIDKKDPSVRSSARPSIEKCSVSRWEVSSRDLNFAFWLQRPKYQLECENDHTE